MFFLTSAPKQFQTVDDLLPDVNDANSKALNIRTQKIASDTARLMSRIIHETNMRIRQGQLHARLTEHKNYLPEARDNAMKWLAEKGYAVENVSHRYDCHCSSHLEWSWQYRKALKVETVGSEPKLVGLP
jgi:hypothetical protein